MDSILIILRNYSIYILYCGFSSTIYLLGILAHVDGEACDEVSDGLHHHFWISQHGLGHGWQQLLLQLGVSQQLQQWAQALKFNLNDLINYPKNTKI